MLHILCGYATRKILFFHISVCSIVTVHWNSIIIFFYHFNEHKKMQVDIIINLLLNFIRSINNTQKIPFFFILLPLKCRAAATASSHWGNGGNIRQTDCFWFNWFYMVWRLFQSGSNETVFDITPSSYEVSWNSAEVTMATGTFWRRHTFLTVHQEINSLYTSFISFGQSRNLSRRLH